MSEKLSDAEIAEAIGRYRKIASAVKPDSALVCDGCGKCWIDDSASDEESCDCGRLKQRMEWATAENVAGEAVKFLLALQSTRAAAQASEERLRGLVDLWRQRVAEIDSIEAARAVHCCQTELEAALTPTA